MPATSIFLCPRILVVVSVAILITTDLGIIINWFFNYGRLLSLDYKVTSLGSYRRSNYNHVGLTWFFRSRVWIFVALAHVTSSTSSLAAHFRQVGRFRKSYSVWFIFLSLSLTLCHLLAAWDQSCLHWQEILMRGVEHITRLPVGFIHQLSSLVLALLYLLQVAVLGFVKLSLSLVVVQVLRSSRLFYFFLLFF